VAFPKEARIRKRRRAVGCLVALGWLLLPGPAGADWFADLETGFHFDDNLPRAELSSDRKSDGALLLAGRGGKSFHPAEAGILSFSASLRSRAFARFDDLSSLALGGRASYRHKLGLGASAPWFSLAVGGAWEGFWGDVRDAAIFDASGEAGIRLWERWDLRAGLRHERRFGMHSEVFDQTGTTVSAQVGYDLNEWILLFLGGEFRRGDVVSSALPNPRVLEAASARIPDTAFGPGVVAYRLDARTYTAIVGTNLAVTDRCSLDVSYERQETRANEGIQYSNNVARLRVLCSF
jgi:opacity protein-like surface antigen